MNDRDLARWRLCTQRLTAQRFVDPMAVVSGLLGVQAENYAQAAWAVAARSATPITSRGFDALFDRGEILRTHVLRPTWHFVRPDDIVWLVELTAPRIRRSYVQNQRDQGLDDATLHQCIDTVVNALAAQGPRTRRQLRAALQSAGLPSAGPVFTVITAAAETMALVCSGPISDGDHSHALIAERAPNPRRLDADEALAELAGRYIAGHGPATEGDLAYWATQSLGAVRRGLAAAEDLACFEHEGRTYWTLTTVTETYGAFLERHATVSFAELFPSPTSKAPAS